MKRLDLGPEQFFVYTWRYKNDTVCKLGVSTFRTFYARITAARTVIYQDIELLGIEVLDSKTETQAIDKKRLETLNGLLNSESNPCVN